MAHITLHVASLRLMQADENLHPLGEEALKRRWDLATLGVVLCDLPWFQDVRRQLVPHLLGRDLVPDRWQARFHHDKPITMGLELLRARASARPLGPLARLSLAMGYVAHAAWDSRLHPLVHKLAAAETGLSEQRAHLRVEKYQALITLPKLTGVPVEDDEDTWGALLRLPTLPDTARALEAVDAATIAARGVGPSAAQWNAWLSGLTQYVALARRRMPFAEGGSVSPDAARARWVDAPGFMDHAMAAQARAVAWCNRLCAAFAEGDVTDVSLAALKRAFPEMDLDAPEDPAAAEATGHELRQQRDMARAWRASRVADHRKDTTALGSNLVQPSRRPPVAAPPPMPVSAPPPLPDPTPVAGTPAPALPPAAPENADGDSYSEASRGAGADAPAGANALRPSGRVPR